jgi:Uma2 family endonuclease
MPTELPSLPPPPEGWTVRDLDRLPDDGKRYEIFDGVVRVAPLPCEAHQTATAALCALLRVAAPPGMRAIPCIGVIVSEDNVFVPDVLVLRGDRRTGRSHFPPQEVLLVVEVVESCTRSLDRWQKPSQYAEAGIPNFWQVELEPLHVVAYRLANEGEYVEVARVDAGSRFQASEPFAVEFDPAELLT